jgi:Kinesin motor domain
MCARETKLNQALAPMLAGNARAFFVACVSPDAASHRETAATLRLALRARSIQARRRLGTENGPSMRRGNGLVTFFCVCVRARARVCTRRA